jgi:hypothetical protein
VNGASGQWTETSLPVPVLLAANSRYRIGFFSGGGPYYWRAEEIDAFNHGTLDGSYFASGDAFPSDFISGGWWLVDLRYEATSFVPIFVTPAHSGNFSSGLWTGSLVITQAATGLVLRAADAEGHAGLSQPFDVLTGLPELSVSYADDQVTLSWPGEFVGFILQTKTDLSSPEPWQPAGAATLEGGRFQIMVQTTNRGAFYRLKSP